MPELKRTFTGGKMEKDLDERILPNGQYREALNIGVATSENSDVGAAQNILGNIKVTSAISSRTWSLATGFGNEHIHGWDKNLSTLDNEKNKTSANKEGFNYHVAEVIDPQTDMLYRFIHTPNDVEHVWMDRIVEYDTSKGLDVDWDEKEHAVMIDIFKVKAKISDHRCICPGSNKSKIMVDRNLHQLRWGMKIEGTEIPDDTTIEHIDYNSGWITLSKPIWTDPAPNQIPPIAAPCNQCQFCAQNGGGFYTFYGDRNLNFGYKDNLHKITGINVIDGMIFWTDNVSEPKKLNIERCKAGSKLRRENQEFIDTFNEHTLLMVTQNNRLEKVRTCTKDESFCPPVGCMDDGNQPWSLYPGDPNASPPIPGTPSLTYDPFAIYHDQSMCCYFGGCTDDTWDGRKRGYKYCNYDPNACFDDGSCCETCGCTDSTACNYNPNACHDDGSCVYGGCMDDMAANYDPNAPCADNSLCRYKWSCIPSGYATTDCPGVLDNNNMFNSALTYTPDPHAIHPNNYNIKYVVPDGIEGSTYVNTNQNTISFGDDNILSPGAGSSAYVITAKTTLNGVKNPGVTKGAWLYGESPSVPIGDWAWEKTTNSPWNCPGVPGCTDDLCTFPVNVNDYSQGYITNMSNKYIIVEHVWAQVDGKNYKDWNENVKAGPGAQPVGWWGGYSLSQTTPTGQQIPNAMYEDINGDFWDPINMWRGTVCFGDCPSQSPHNGKPLGSWEFQNGGSTHTDIITYFRNNGYDGNGPSVYPWDPTSASGSYPAGQFGGWAQLEMDYHGLGAYVGTTPWADFYDWYTSGGTSGTPPNGNHPTMGLNTSWPATHFLDGTFKYNCGTYPEVKSGDNLVEVWAKVTNYGTGWSNSGFGDLPMIGMWHFVETPCGCSDWNTNPQCVKDPNGPFVDQGDCYTCATCDCNPQNVSWECVNNVCVQVPGLNGTFSSLSNCQLSGCSNIIINPTP